MRAVVLANGATIYHLSGERLSGIAKVVVAKLIGAIESELSVLGPVSVPDIGPSALMTVVEDNVDVVVASP